MTVHAAWEPISFWWGSSVDAVGRGRSTLNQVPASRLFCHHPVPYYAKFELPSDRR